jgi:hypothetical protein
MTISGDFENGIKWIGDKGWIFVCRDTWNHADHNWERRHTPIVPLRASDPKILDSVIGPIGMARLHIRRSAWKLARLHTLEKTAGGPGGDWPSRLLHMPAALDRDEDAASCVLGSEDGDDSRR